MCISKQSLYIVSYCWHSEEFPQWIEAKDSSAQYFPFTDKQNQKFRKSTKSRMGKTIRNFKSISFKIFVQKI